MLKSTIHWLCTRPGGGAFKGMRQSHIESWWCRQKRKSFAPRTRWVEKILSILITWRAADVS
jgi:hypothetical protein